MRMSKRCSKCLRSKPESEFRIANKKGPTGLRSACRECEAEMLRTRYRSNPTQLSASAKKWRSKPGVKEYLRDKARLYRQAIKLDVMTHYGGKCACCGEDRMPFLCIDHANNDGAEHRRKIGMLYIYKWLQQQGYPPGFQVLCWNCNNAKRFGVCPHQVPKTS